MNLEIVLMCAQTTARHQLAALGAVDSEVQALIDELTAPAPVAEEAPAPKTRKPRATAVVEEAPVVEAVVAEEAPVVEEAPAAE